MPASTPGHSEQGTHGQVPGDSVWSLGATEREPETRSQELVHGCGV